MAAPGDSGEDLPDVMDTLKTTRAQLIVLKNDGGSSSCVGVSCASPFVPSEELSSSPCQVSYSRPKQGFVATNPLTRTISVSMMGSNLDIDEEAEDMQAELGAEEQEMEGEEEEENEEAEVDEEVISEKKMHYGDSKNFCPVAIKDNFILQPGLQDNAALYREKTYYCSSPEARNTFLQNPENYVVHNEPLQAPPLRVLLIGTGGTGKTANAKWLANKVGMFHIQFQERLQEIMLSKLEKKVGPHHEEESIEEEMTDEAMLLLLENVNAEESKKEESKDSKEEVVLTVEEAAIKSYLTDNELYQLKCWMRL